MTLHRKHYSVKGGPRAQPSITRLARQTDTDNDGMSDEWEIKTLGDLDEGPHTVSSNDYKKIENWRTSCFLDGEAIPGSDYRILAISATSEVYAEDESVKVLLAVVEGLKQVR